MEDICEEYRSSLEDLSCNSKPLINMLTMLAEDNASYAPKIVQVIENHLQKVNPDVKLPVMYLIDSIIKNVGGPYNQLFTQNIVSVFSNVFEKVDEKTRVQLFKLRQTWSEVFPAKKMYAIDKRVNDIDPAWPITAPKPNIHFNPKFLDNKTPAPSPKTPTPRPVIHVPVVDQQQAEVRQQVIAKQQELLKLQQQRLELELLQAKVKLEEQTRRQASQGLQFVPPMQLPFMPALDPRLNRREANLRDPRIQKLIPPMIPSKVVQPLVPQISLPSKVVQPLVVSPIRQKLISLPQKQVPVIERSPAKSDNTNNLPKNQVTKSTNNENSKNVDKSLPVNKPVTQESKSPPKNNSDVSSPPKNKKQEATKSQPIVNNGTSNNKTESNNSEPDKSKSADPMIIDLTDDDDKTGAKSKSPAKKPSPKRSPKTKGKSRKKIVSPEKSGSDKLGDVDKRSSNDTDKKDSKKSNQDDRVSDKRSSDRKSEKKSRKSRDRSPTRSRSRSPRKSKEKKKKVEDTDVDLRFIPPDLEEPNKKKAKLDEIDSLFGGKDQDYRVLPSSPSNSPPHKDKWSSPDKDKKNSWAQYKASHPDEYKSPMRRDSHDNFQDQDMRINKPGRSDRDFDRLGRPLLSRMKIDRQISDSFGKESVHFMLDKQEEILQEAQIRLRAGLITPLEFQTLHAKLRRLGELKLQEEENRKALAGVRIPPSKPIFLDGKMREITFLGRRAIVQMDGGNHHELGFAGSPTRVFLDERELFRLDFNGECREFTTPVGNSHTVMFGAPSREVYIDGVPYEASFGGQPFPVLLDGHCYHIRLDGPQPSVELSDQPVRGFPLGPLPNDNLDFRHDDVDMRLRDSPQRRNSPQRRGSPSHRRNSPMPWIENPEEQIWRNEQRQIIMEQQRPPLLDARNLNLDQSVINRPNNIDPHFFNEAPWKNNDWDWRNKMNAPQQMPLLQRPPLRPDMDNMRPDMNVMRPDMNVMRPDMNLVNAIRPDMCGMRQDMGPPMRPPEMGQMNLGPMGQMRPDMGPPMRPEMNMMRPPPPEMNAMRPPLLIPHLTNMPFNTPPPPLGQFQHQFNPPFRRMGLLGNQPGPPPQNIGNMAEPTLHQQQPLMENRPEPPLVEEALDVNALLAKLISSGLINTELAGPPKKDEEEEEDVPVSDEKIPHIELSSESLKARYPGVMGILYRGTQCASCGMRFKEAQQEKYSQHLDWHFRANRREKDGVKKAFSRKWFYDVEDWIQFEEIEDLEDRARSFFELQAGPDAFPTEPVPAGVTSVPASQDQSDNMCVVCSEPFQLFWVEDEEEWHLRGAIRKEGKTYHPLCYDDFAKIPETPVDESGDSEKPFFKEEPMETEEKEEEESEEKPEETEEKLETAGDEEKKAEGDEEKAVEGEKESEEKIEEAQEMDVTEGQETSEDTVENEEPKENTEKEEPPVEDPEIRECDKAPVIEEEIIGLIEEEEETEEESQKEPLEESQMVVLPAAGTGKIVMKVKAESIAVERPATPVQEEKEAPVVKEEGEDTEGYSELEVPIVPGYEVLEPVERGKELSGLCSIM